MRRRRRLRCDFGKQAEQDTKYSHSHTHSHSRSHTHTSHSTRTRVSCCSYNCAAKTKRRHNFVSIRRSSCSPSRSLSLFLACVAGPVGCGRARRITKTKLSTICARPFFAAVAAYLMVSVFSFSTSKIPIRQQHTHTHARTPLQTHLSRVRVFTKFSHTHTHAHTVGIFYIISLHFAAFAK